MIIETNLACLELFKKIILYLVYSTDGRNILPFGRLGPNPSRMLLPNSRDRKKIYLIVLFDSILDLFLIFIYDFFEHNY